MTDKRAFSALVIMQGGQTDGMGLARAMGILPDEIACVALSEQGPRRAGALAYAGFFQKMAEKYRPRFIIFGHNLFSMEMAPLLAARLGAGFVPGISGVCRQAMGGYTFQRPVMNSKLNLSVNLRAEIALLTAVPGAFAFENETCEVKGLILSDIEEIPETCVRWSQVSVNAQDLGLAQADVVVAAGRGVGPPENMRLIEETSGLFARSAIAGTRGACDAGLVPVGRQVGMTGKSVSPRLYFACGVSGARQHTCGFSGAAFVVAVNRDPAAPIFRVADVCVNEDLTRFLPEFIRACQEAK